MGDSKVRRIVVRVTDEQNRVRTEVADTGPGIAPELLPQLFEPYVRGANGEPTGIGLGLATVKRLAEGHHGRAAVQSKLGEGSRFAFVLPRAGSSWLPSDEAAGPDEDRVEVRH
jgi:signal transduction histidine kinase